VDRLVEAAIPEEWLRREFLRQLSAEDRGRIEALGGLDKLIEEFRKRLAEQQGRHQGGNRWIGTGGTSPFGNSGYNPEGFRVGQAPARDAPSRSGSSAATGTSTTRSSSARATSSSRSVGCGVFARQGAAEELDLPARSTTPRATRAFLHLRMRPSATTR
jgi:uncharacterized protein with von Willebrand factor type A (vWA) domain